MKICYVCGSELDGQSPQCGHCGTTVAFLEQVQQTIARPRFLFGSGEMPKQMEPESGQAPPAANAAPPRAKKAPKRHDPAPRAQTDAPRPRREIPREGAAGDLDLIESRDNLGSSSPSPTTPPGLRGKAHVLDVALCFALNFIVLGIILWVSPRDFAEMVTFSLIPLMFVLLCFTFLYFWLFWALFQKTMGRMLLDFINRRQGGRQTS